jgi:hypothetical protein
MPNANKTKAVVVFFAYKSVVHHEYASQGHSHFYLQVFRCFHDAVLCNQLQKWAIHWVTDLPWQFIHLLI